MDYPKRVLITGAAGNLGTKLRHGLQGRCGLVLVDSSPGGDSLIYCGDVSIWDEAWVRLFADVATVVHLAANPSPSAPWSQLVPNNIDSVLNVYEACLRHGVGRVIFASSNHVMGGYAAGEVPLLRSDTPPLPGNPYGATKLLGERSGRNYSARHGISSINVRIGWNRREKENRPGADMDDWGRKMWLSDGDYLQLMECCIRAPDALRWGVVNGVSNNRDTHWDLSEARALVGYRPVDDAFDPQWDTPE